MYALDPMYFEIKLTVFRGYIIKIHNNDPPDLEHFSAGGKFELIL